MTALAANIRMLADRYHGGSVNAMAGTTGITQATLWRLVEGISTSPRARTLHRIAEYYGTTIDWLLTGAGDAPDDGTVARALLTGELADLIGRYGPAAVRQALAEFPGLRNASPEWQRVN